MPRALGRQPVRPAANGATVFDPGQAAEFGRIAGLQIGVDHLPAVLVGCRRQVAAEIAQFLGDALDDLGLAEPGIAPGHRHQVVARRAAFLGGGEVLADDRAEHLRELRDVHGAPSVAAMRQPVGVMDLSCSGVFREHRFRRPLRGRRGKGGRRRRQARERSDRPLRRRSRQRQFSPFSSAFRFRVCHGKATVGRVGKRRSRCQNRRMLKRS